MKSFNRTMGIVAGIFFILVVGSVSIGASYIKSNKLDSLEFWNETTNLDYSDDWDFDGIFSNKKSSEYDTKEISDTKTFSLQPELYVSSSFEEITFIEENRDDIQVDYYREYPDVDSYRISYDASESNNRITITSTLSVRDIAVNKPYQGNIEIHIPVNYQFEQITLESAATKIESDNIYTRTKELNITASLGDIDINIDNPLEILNVQCSMGSIDLNVEADIDTLNIECSLGKVDLNLEGEIVIFSIQNDIGDTNVEAEKPIDEGNINSNLGDVTGSFRDNISTLFVECSMGNIDMSFQDNKNMLVYIDTDLGDVSVDEAFNISEEPSNFIFTSSLGNINIEED